MSIPALLDRVMDVVSSLETLMLLKAWALKAKILVSSALGRHLDALSEALRHRSWRAVTYCGVDVLIPPALLEPRPCAVKVLTQDSCSKGAYGQRSAENEVCIFIMLCCPGICGHTVGAVELVGHVV